MLLISRFTQKEQEKEAQKCVLLDQVHAHFVKFTKEEFAVVYMGTYHFKMIVSKGNILCTESTSVRKMLRFFPPQKFADIKVLSLFIVKVIHFNLISYSSKKWVKFKSPCSF
jgi:hypothetical protein